MTFRRALLAVIALALPTMLFGVASPASAAPSDMDTFREQVTSRLLKYGKAHEDQPMAIRIDGNWSGLITKVRVYRDPSGALREVDSRDGDFSWETVCNKPAPTTGVRACFKRYDDGTWTRVGDRATGELPNGDRGPRTGLVADIAGTLGGGWTVSDDTSRHVSNPRKGTYTVTGINYRYGWVFSGDTMTFWYEQDDNTLRLTVEPTTQQTVPRPV